MRQILGRKTHLAIYSVLGLTNAVNLCSSFSTLYIQVVSGGKVNILEGGRMDYSE
jgi:hypothetical protein